MATEITGGNTQVGTQNKQFIKAIETTNNNNITFNVNVNIVNCSESQHQHQEGVSISGGDVDQLITTLKSIVSSCGQTSQKATETTIPAQSEEVVNTNFKPTNKAQHGVVRKRKEEVTGLYEETQETLKDSVRIVDSLGRLLNPGVAVLIDYKVYSLYIGDGNIVHCYNGNSKTVVKGKLDMSLPFCKLRPFNDSNVNVFPPEKRVERGLQHVGKRCPVSDDLDFLHWTFTDMRSWPMGFMIEYQ